MNEIGIRVENLSKKYVIAGRKHDTARDHLVDSVRTILSRKKGAGTNQTFWALQDVSFELKQGEVLGVVGQNGAGKSTLLKILSRITTPSSGRATLTGRVASLLEVGTGFHGELTGRENIYFNGALLGMKKSEIDRNFEQIVDFSGVEKFIDTPVKRYSSGMYIRLAFSVAAHLESEILIVDEVLAVGDTSFQSKCLGKMSEISRAGRVVIFVSHHLGSVARLCSRAILLQSGKMTADGKPARVIATYIERTGGNQTENGYRNLRDVSHRRGNGVARFVSARSVKMDGQTTSLLAYGEPFIFQLELEATRRIDQLLIGFAITASDGTMVQCTETPDDHSNFAMEPGLNTVECHVSPTLLVPGKYRISVGANVAMGNVDCDWVENALTLEILNTSYTPKDRLPTNLGGYLHVPYQWTLKQGDGAARPEAVMQKAQD